MRAGGKVDCNAVVCVADGMCAEETCGSGSGGEAHRVRWPAAISPMRPLQSASFVASQRQTSCWCSERTGARTVKTRKRAFMSSVKSPWGECLAPGGFHQRGPLSSACPCACVVSGFRRGNRGAGKAICTRDILHAKSKNIKYGAGSVHYVKKHKNVLVRGAARARRRNAETKSKVEDGSKMSLPVQTHVLMEYINLSLRGDPTQTSAQTRAQGPKSATY